VNRSSVDTRHLIFRSYTFSRLLVFLQRNSVYFMTSVKAFHAFQSCRFIRTSHLFAYTCDSFSWLAPRRHNVFF